MMRNNTKTAISNLVIYTILFVGYILRLIFVGVFGLYPQPKICMLLSLGVVACKDVLQKLFEPVGT
jgi:hypothetical protein